MQRTDFGLLLLIFPWKCLSYCLKLSCLWTCLQYSKACSLCYPLDMSVLAAGMNVSVHSSLSCSWTCLFYCRQCCPWTCSFYSPAAACAVHGVHGHAWARLFYSCLCRLWTCMFYCSLYCSWTCVFFTAACAASVFVCSTAYFAALDMFVLQQSVMPCMCTVCYTVVCTTPEHIYSTVDCAAPDHVWSTAAWFLTLNTAKKTAFEVRKDHFVKLS
jgi:hypothetical protein